ncbi:MAG: DUF6602 domain-containing protein [Pyrinomonadaceae bacterium]
MIAAQAAVAGGTEHCVTTGRIREIIAHRFLRPHLPRNLDIKSGVIIDQHDNRSAQQDCVLLDNRLPLVDVGSDFDALLIAESVIATIEIKSELNKSHLLTSLKSCARTKSLVRSGGQEYRKVNAKIIIPNALPILTYIFAYDGMNLDTAFQHVQDFAAEKQDGRLVPDAICILKKGVLLRSQMMPTVVGNNVTLPRADGSLDLSSKPYAKDALLAFYRRVIDDVIPVRLVNYDFDGYYSEADLE